MTLRLIATGGTFDKHYNELNGTLGFTESHLPDVIKRSRMTIPVALDVLPLLDSLDMQDADRARILAACQAAPEQAIVIVHGTDTMPETAAVLGAAALHKTIVLTGAMIPYAIANSDAQFNLGLACGERIYRDHGRGVGSRENSRRRAHHDHPDATANPRPTPLPPCGP